MSKITIYYDNLREEIANYRKTLCRECKDGDCQDCEKKKDADSFLHFFESLSKK